MLDSLVRVSRRVGGATDLLATEMRPATENCSLYETAPVPVGRAAQPAELGPSEKGTNFTRGCGANPTVRRVKRQRSATFGKAWQGSAVIADQAPPGSPNKRLNL